MNINNTQLLGVSLRIGEWVWGYLIWALNRFYVVDYAKLIFCIGDSCCNPLSLGRLIDYVKKQVPGIYTHSMKFGDNILEDTLSGFFTNSNKQIDMACKNLSADENLKSGFNVIGFSQGGQFWWVKAQGCSKRHFFSKGDDDKVLTVMSVLWWLWRQSKGCAYLKSYYNQNLAILELLGELSGQI